MGSHPINLLFRFLLELVVLAALCLWGYKQSEGFTGLVLMILIPAGVAVIWGIFNVPDDPSRSGKAPVPIPGFLRLIIELCIFGFAIWTLYDMGFQYLFFIFGALVIIHYLFSYDRIAWLFSH